MLKGKYIYTECVVIGKVMAMKKILSLIYAYQYKGKIAECKKWCV